MVRRQHSPGSIAYCTSSYFEILLLHAHSRKTLRQFWEWHPDSEGALARWFKIGQRHDFTSFETVRATFPTADKVGEFIVFNIGGNKYRLVTAIHLNRRKVYLRHALTHQDDDRGAWKPWPLCYTRYNSTGRRSVRSCRFATSTTSWCSASTTCWMGWSPTSSIHCIPC